MNDHTSARRWRACAAAREYYDSGMRTTVELGADTAKAVERLRREHGHGLSQAINELTRRGLKDSGETAPFVPRSQPLGLRVDVSNIADALKILEGTDAR